MEDSAGDGALCEDPSLITSARASGMSLSHRPGHSVVEQPMCPTWKNRHRGLSITGASQLGELPPLFSDELCVHQLGPIRLGAQAPLVCVELGFNEGHMCRTE